MFVSRVWTSSYPWKCYGLAQDEENRLWFIDSNWKTEETQLMCYDLKKKELIKGTDTFLLILSLLKTDRIIWDLVNPLVFTIIMRNSAL